LDRQQSLKQRLEEFKVKRVCAVRFRVRGVVVNFEEKAVYSSGDGSTREQRDKLRLAATRTAGSRGLLNRVRAVEDDWCGFAHDGQRAVVDDEVVVAK